MRIHADLDPGKTFSLKSQNDEFLHEKCTENSLKVKNISKKAQGRKPGLFVNFGKFPYSWIRIRIPNTVSDPGQPNQCRSGSTTLISSDFVATVQLFLPSILDKYKIFCHIL
jgi:hypothetical protein